MRLLLDEMISPRVVRELRDHGHDVHSIKGDRPELEGLSDLEIVAAASAEMRAVVTNDVGDFQPIHGRLITTEQAHFGMVFTTDSSMPRNRENISLWVDRLSRFLADHPAEDALINRVHYFV